MSLIFGNLDGLNKSFLSRLGLAAKDSGVSFRVTSGYRTVAKNIAVGGAVNSAHLKGIAVDLDVSDSVKRFCIVKSLLEYGFRRVGIGKTHVHVDGSFDLPQRVLFLE